MRCHQSRKKSRVNRAKKSLTFTLNLDLAKMKAISNSSQRKNNLMLLKSLNLICTKSKNLNCKFWCKQNLVRCKPPKRMFLLWASSTLRSSHRSIQLLTISLLKLNKQNMFLTSFLLWLIKTTSSWETSWFLYKMNSNRQQLSLKNFSLDFNQKN